MRKIRFGLLENEPVPNTIIAIIPFHQASTLESLVLLHGSRAFIQDSRSLSGMQWEKKY